MLKKQAIVQKTASFQMKWLEVKATGDGHIRIKGFASTPQMDRYDDIVAPEAFANAMTQYMTNPVVLLGHNPDKILGQVIEYNLSTAGLEVTVDLSNDIENTFQNIMDKNLRGFSIGFICKGYNLSETNDREIRTITELDLIEISVVSTPANPSSLFTLAKSLKNLFSEIDKKEAEGEEAPAPVAEEITPAPEKTAEEIEAEEKATIKTVHCKSCEGGDCPGVNPADLPADGEDGMHCEGCKGKDCGGMVAKPTKDADVENPESPEEPEDTKENPKTEKEAPTGETPETPEVVDVPAPDKTDIVEGDEKPKDEPKGLSEDEVKVLVGEEVAKAIAPVLEALEEAKNSARDSKNIAGEIAIAYEELEAKHLALEKSHKTLESDVLKIEIPSGGFSSKKASQIVVSDAMVLKSIGA